MAGAADTVRRRRSAGFTLLDLLMVVAILGIVTAVAVQVGTTEALRVDATARAVAADLHEVQTLAIQTRVPLGVRFSVAGNRSTLTMEDGTLIEGNESALRAKAGLSTADAGRILAVDTYGELGFAPGRLTAADFGGGETIVFGTDGRPRTSGYVEVGVGKALLRVRVQAATGRVTVTAP